MKNNWVITIVVAIVVAAVAFFGGMKYQQSHALASNANAGFGQNFGRRGQNGQGARTGGRGGFGGANVGEIVSMDANSVTIKLQDGSSKIVNLSSSTTYSKTDTASKTDLKTGDRIAAFGTANSDGSITAQNIQVNPMFRVGPGGAGAGRPQASPAQ